MSRVGSIGYQVREMLNQVNGIGTSKMAARNESGLKAENGHKVSDKVHSAKSLDNLKDDLNNLGQYAKAEHNIKDMSQITKDVIEAWINSKDIKYDTASNYLSELNKVSDFMSYTRADIKEIRTELKETLERTKIQDMSSRAYKNADKIEVPDKYKPALELQRDHGLRSSAARTIDLDKQLKGNTLSFKEKGGKEGQRELSPSLVSKLKENAVNGKYNVPRTSLDYHLKKSIETEKKEKYNGQHGLRHSYAQNRIEDGATKQEVSEELGHSREEITRAYLR